MLTSRADYLTFGCLSAAMLQESTESKGPRVPGSIQSMQDSIKTWGTTLMRITSQGRILEFSDLGCQISDVRASRARTGVTGLTWPGLVALAFITGPRESTL